MKKYIFEYIEVATVQNTVKLTITAESKEEAEILISGKLLINDSDFDNYIKETYSEEKQTQVLEKYEKVNSTKVFDSEVVGTEIIEVIEERSLTFDREEELDKRDLETLHC